MLKVYGQNTNAWDEQHRCYSLYAKPIIFLTMKKRIGYPARLSALASAVLFTFYLVVGLTRDEEYCS